MVGYIKVYIVAIETYLLNSLFSQISTEPQIWTLNDKYNSTKVIKILNELTNTLFYLFNL